MRIYIFVSKKHTNKKISTGKFIRATLGFSFYLQTIKDGLFLYQQRKVLLE